MSQKIAPVLLSGILEGIHEFHQRFTNRLRGGVAVLRAEALQALVKLIRQPRANRSRVRGLDRPFAFLVFHVRHSFPRRYTRLRTRISHCSTHSKPLFAFFRPFRRFLRWKGRTTHHQRKKPPQRRTGGQIRPLRRRARPLCARWLARLPVRLALRPSGRGAGEFVARPSVRRVRRPCPRSAPRARRSRLRRPRCFCGSMRCSVALTAGEGAANNRAPVPPGLRRRRPSGRRAAVRWRGRAVSGARGEGAAAPAPAGRLCAVRLVGLAAGRALPCVRVTGWRVAFAPFRRARGLPPGACLADGRSACRGVGQSWPFCFAGACPPSPAAPV